MIGLVAAHVKVGDKEFSHRTAEVVHVERGRVNEWWPFPDDTQAIGDFFNSLGG